MRLDLYKDALQTFSYWTFKTSCKSLIHCFLRQVKNSVMYHFKKIKRKENKISQVFIESRLPVIVKKKKLRNKDQFKMRYKFKKTGNHS